MQGKWPGLKALRYGLLLAVSVATLSGCVSAVSNDMRADTLATQESEENVADAAADETTTPVVADSQAAQDQLAATDASAESDQQAGSDMAGLVMQSASVNAGKASIFSEGGQVTPTANAYATQTGGANATTGNLYASNGATQDAQQTGRLPVEDMPPVGSTATLGDGETMPENIPIPTTARTALVAEAATGNAAEKALASPDNAASVELPDGNAQAGQRKAVTLASLFSGKRDARQQRDGERLAEKPKRMLNRDNVGSLETASLGALPGVSTANSMLSDNHSESEEVEDDAPQFREVSSIAGLARLAPNGLWLQTEKVSTGCFKPELLHVLKTIEKHYDKPIIVTSGLRGIKPNRKKQSLHTRCEAADIQISGVSKWELAEYLRSMPGRGGVGTYCHTESVHIDIGPQRDWNWRCRRKK